MLFLLFSIFFLKVKDSWDVDSAEESEDSSKDKGVYVKKKTLFFSFAVKDCRLQGHRTIVQLLYPFLFLTSRSSRQPCYFHRRELI